MTGLVGTGRAYLDQANSLASTAAGLETRRMEEKKMAKAADQAKTGQLAGMGAGIGMMAGGPIGAVAGAAIGYMVGSFV